MHADFLRGVVAAFDMGHGRDRNDIWRKLELRREHTAGIPAARLFDLRARRNSASAARWADVFLWQFDTWYGGLAWADRHSEVIRRDGLCLRKNYSKLPGFNHNAPGCSDAIRLRRSRQPGKCDKESYRGQRPHPTYAINP